MSSASVVDGDGKVVAVDSKMSDKLPDVRLSRESGKSTRSPGSVFKQNDITEVQMKNTLIPATI